jgi:DNA helicase IV
MPVIMAELVAQRGWLPRLLLGWKGSILSVCLDGLLVSGDGSDQLVAASEMSQPTQVARGLFWSRLVVKTADATLHYRGFRKEDLSAVADSLNIKLRVYAEKRLESESSELFSVVKEIQDFLSGQRYARDSRRKQLVDLSIKAMEVRKHSFWSLFANPSQAEAAETVAQFIQDSERLVREANTSFVGREISAFKQFFDTVEKNPLTLAQRQSCVINQDNNLVLAGAGTGKTSTMIGRAGYLLASGQAQPDELLMLAYGRKAAEEMQERQDKCLRPLLTAGTPTIKTFHALGLEIIGKVEGKRPAVSPLAEDAHAFALFIDEQLTEQLRNAVYKSKIVRFFTSYLYPYRNPFDFNSMQEYNDYVRQHELRTLQGEVVKSYEECEIANFLLQHSVRYKYEEPYPIDTAGPDFRQYKPDFFLPDHGIYIEHFALDKAGRPPAHFDQRRYLDGIKWKRELHAGHKTTLIETYSHLKGEGRLQTVLSEALIGAGVILTQRPDEEMLAELKEQGKVSEFALLLSDFLTLFKQSYLAWAEFWDKIKTNIDAERMGFLIEIFRPIYDSYQRHLQERKEIDFADMIGKAIEHIEMGHFHSPYMHIMVDELQDISPARARLILALRRQRSESVLYAVGDDWQSIYRFTGSDIGITKRFEDIFGATAVTALDTTFRFNNQIGEVASTFVLKNPEQIKKTIRSLATVNEPAVSVIRVLDGEYGLQLALNSITKQAEPRPGKKTTVLVLGRYNFVVSEESISRDRLRKAFPKLDITLMTVHAAKGKEADYVVVLDLIKGKHGFPSEKVTDALLELLLPQQEPFRFAEERRLFYVALTRARHRVYLVYNPLMASSFVKELANENYPICKTEFDESFLHPDIADVGCPRCKTGSLVPRKGEDGSFIGCNNYPYCKYTEHPCPQCDDLMQRDGRFKICVNSKCGGVVPLCPDCGAEMVKRNGPYGSFWGCLNYRLNSDFICTHTEKRITFPINSKQQQRTQTNGVKTNTTNGVKSCGLTKRF